MIPIARRNNAEHKFQKQVIQFLNLALPSGTFLTSIDHAGGGRIAGALRKARGVRAGLPDVHFEIKGQAYWIELKAPGGTLADEQRACMQDIMKAGGKVWLAKDMEDVMQALASWGIPLRARLSDPPAVAASRTVA